MKRVLLTGFGNFGSVTNNPSEELVKLLNKHIEGLNIYVFEGYKDIDDNLTDVLDKFKPEVIIMFGLASKTPFVRLERFAKRPNKNHKGRIMYKSKLPLGHIHKLLRAQNIETQYSDDAGSYWCNYLFYKVGLLINDSDVVYGFIHLPNLAKYEDAYHKKLDMLGLGEALLESIK